MVFYVGSEKLEFSDKQLKAMYKNAGDEASVYKHGGKALKLYKSSCKKDRLSEDAVHFLMRYSGHTKRVLLPTDAIRDENGEFLGYAEDYIKPQRETGILHMKMKDFISEVDLLSRDVDFLSSNGVHVYDFYMGNVIFNNGIYVVDPGSYDVPSGAGKGSKINIEPSLIQNIREGNNYELKHLVVNSIFGMLPLSAKETKKVESMFSNSDSLCTVLTSTANENETVKQYVRRIAS